MESYIGPLAGIATSTLWVTTSIFFTSAGRRIGSTAVNAIRLVIAVILLGLTHLILTGSVWPELSDSQLMFLTLSGLAGLTICDQALFTAFVDIGPSRALLIMSTSPIFAVLFGIISGVDATQIGAVALFGIGITIVGVMWVVRERAGQERKDEQPHIVRGHVLAFVGAITQALGYVLATVGMQADSESEALNPQAVTYVRLAAGTAFMMPLLVVYGIGRKSESRLRARSRRIGSRPIGYLLTLGGAIVGPYMGIWMSMVAARYTPNVAVAQTLCSLAPILIVPVAALVYKEKVTRRSLLGALLAVVGAAMLVLASG